MKPLRHFSLLLCSFSFVMIYACKTTDKSPRKRICINGDWEFIRLNQLTHDSLASNPSISIYDTTRTDFSSQFLNDFIPSDDIEISDILRNEASNAVENFNKEYPLLQASLWSKVTLPHTATIEPLESKELAWEGVCYYRKSILYSPLFAGKETNLQFEGAMQQSDVWVNGQLVMQHKGGYTPFFVNLTQWLSQGKSVEIIVRIDNHADKTFPVGKPLARNGYTYWSGLYRGVYLSLTNPIYVTNPVQENKVAGGGVFFRTPEVTKEKASVIVLSDVRNKLSCATSIQVKQQLYNLMGKLVKEVTSPLYKIPSNDCLSIKQDFEIKNPELWSPNLPYLYKLKTIILSNQSVVDEFSQRVGIRSVNFCKQSGMTINGESFFMVGTNLHQDYPYIGVALSDNAHYRDVKRIKEAGYNAVRLAHYPHDPSVYDAADELGVLLIDAIPGWQFFNESKVFKYRAFRDMRDMIHRDRNHPSVVLWEVNLNECYPPDNFRLESHMLAHQELPEGEYFTTGETYGSEHTYWDVPMSNWTEPEDSIYRNTVERVQNVQPGYPYIIKEYADWEFGGYYSTTRSSRVSGEESMRQGLWNTHWSHNANRINYGSLLVGDFTWAMYDNYISANSKLFEWGTYDYFRLPKFISYLFRSQYEPYVKMAGVDSNKPVAFIANWWAEKSNSNRVIVYSNCDKVLLKVNNRVVGSKRADSGETTVYGRPEKGGNPFDAGNCKALKYPPFTFFNLDFVPGVLTAVGYLGGKKVVTTYVCTPEEAVKLRLSVDFSSKPLAADKGDVVFVHASLVDKKGTVVCLDNNTEVKFLCSAGAKIVGPSKVKVRGGIASVLVQSDTLVPLTVTLFAQAQGLASDRIKLNIK